MPLYEYYCETCRREVTLTMTISEHDKGGAVCPAVPGPRHPPTSRELLLEDVSQVLILAQGVTDPAEGVSAASSLFVGPKAERRQGPNGSVTLQARDSRTRSHLSTAHRFGIKTDT